MELHFSVTPAHTETRLAAKLALETRKHDALIARVETWQNRQRAWLRRLFPFLARLLAPREPRKPLQRLNHRLIAFQLRQALKASEGHYCMAFDDQGLSLSRAKGAKAKLAWGQVTHLRETPDFYAVSCARLERKGKALYIARHSELMPQAAYQQGLQAFLSQCPVPPTSR